MLEARHLTKRYHGIPALQDVSFDIRPGEILGYLGPNGSGKSTTINMVVGLVEPSNGTLSLFGDRLFADAAAYKRHIGYVPEEPYLYTHLTALEYLSLVAGLRGLSAATTRHRTTELLKLFDLWDSRYQVMSAYSKGMRQRVLLAAALLHNPPFLVLDEPFSGLDVNAAVLFRTLLRQFVGDGGMILFSSHRFDVVEQVCTRVLILNRGRAVADGRIADLRASHDHDSLEELFARVTEQDDYSAVARRILEIVRS